MISYLTLMWLMLAPVTYAYWAGHAFQNLIDTEIYHKWTFAVFCVGTAVMLAFWLTQQHGIMCNELNEQWQSEWFAHVKKYHEGEKLHAQ